VTLEAEGKSSERNAMNAEMGKLVGGRKERASTRTSTSGGDCRGGRESRQQGILIGQGGDSWPGKIQGKTSYVGPGEGGDVLELS